MAYKLSLTDYMMKRDGKYGMTQEVRDNAEGLLVKVNKLLDLIEPHVTLDINPGTGTYLSSGWRPAELNAKVPGAAIKSKHITGLALDLYDPDGDIDNYLMSNLGVLEECGLWLEHPLATKNWCHLQSVPPKSGNRVFYP